MTSFAEVPSAGAADRELLRLRAEQRRAAAYAEFFGPVTRRFLPYVEDALPAAARLVLDLGAGGGRLATLLNASGRRCIAVDISPAMLAADRENTVAAVVADAGALPFAGAGVDAVTAVFLLPHLNDPARALAEVTRVLRRDGTLVLVGWAAADASPFTGLASSLLARHGGVDTRGPLAEAERRTAVGWMTELVHIVGFTGVQVQTLSSTVPVESPRRWWRGMTGASTGLSQLLHVSEPDVRRRVQEEFLAAAEVYRAASELAVPVAAHVLRAQRPKGGPVKEET